MSELPDRPCAEFATAVPHPAHEWNAPAVEFDGYDRHLWVRVKRVTARAHCPGTPMSAELVPMRALRCEGRIYWWDLDMQVRCLLRPEHAGPHTDGIQAFTTEQAEAAPVPHWAPRRKHSRGAVRLATEHRNQDRNQDRKKRAFNAARRAQVQAAK